MKVGFDISQIAHGGGVATYTQNLAERLAEQKDLQLVFFYTSLRKPYYGKLPDVKSYCLPPTLAEKIFNDWRFVPIEKFLGDIDIYHSSDWLQPPTKAKKVTTYHDVVPLKYPQWSHRKIIDVHKKRLELVEKEIDIVIAVSQATKKDLIKISSIPEDKITVIYEGVSPAFKKFDPGKVEAFRKRMKLPEEFILAIGGVGERRNLDRVKEVAKDYSLVITGQTVPWLSGNDLPLLYNAASLLLYPSFYEGFGLPVLEAMACGTPVITSNVSSLPEVGGEAAVYVNPMKTTDIAQKVKLVLNDEDLREKLIKKGFIQAEKFSWNKCIKETIDVYWRLLKK